MINFKNVNPFSIKNFITMSNVIVMYPQPTDVAQFEKDYADHVRLFDEKMGVTPENKPYTIFKMVTTPDGTPPYYLMSVIRFNSIEEMQAAMASPQVAELTADAYRISSGGAPVFMVGVNG